MQRPGEVSGMHDDEIDIDNGLWIIPGARTKVGRDLAVPLSTEAVEVIERARALRQCGDKAAPIFGISRMALSQAMRRLCLRINLMSATPHDLRRTGRTALTQERLSISHETAERVIGHLVGSSVSRVYDRNAYLREKRIALERWAALVRTIVNCQTPI